MTAMQIKGQQLPHYSQYMFNEFLINPAIAGVYDYYQIRTNHRFQWIGLDNSPLTNSISFYGPHTKMDMGFGASIYTDITGPTSRTSLSGSYGYNILIVRDLRLSMGLSLSMLQYKIDGTQLDPKDVSDPVILNQTSNSILPDASVGIYLYDRNFYAGISAMQLLNNKIKIFDQKTGMNRLKSHFYIVGGYLYKVDYDWIVEPTAIIKVTAPNQFRFEVNGKVKWQNKVWLGVGYRFHDAVSVMLGYNYEDKFSFGYAYDIGITDLRMYNSGSHELSIGYRFNDIK